MAIRRLERHEFFALSSEEREAYLRDVYAEDNAVKQEDKKPQGRPRNEGALRVPRNVSVTMDDYETLREYGKGNASAGFSRAARLIRKYDLFNKED